MNDRLAWGLFKTLWVLRDYLPEIVVGGGWAPFLYHRYLFRGSNREPIYTRDIDLMVENVTELSIDDYPLAEGNAPMHVRVPTPAAYLFHKGLIYERRVDPRKGDKDLYYIFNILVEGGEFKTAIFKDFIGLSIKRPAWFRRFIGQIEADFADPGSEGVLRVSGQRPPNAFPGLDDDQFRQFVLGTFRETLDSLRPLVRAR